MPQDIGEQQLEEVKPILKKACMESAREIKETLRKVDLRRKSAARRRELIEWLESVNGENSYIFEGSEVKERASLSENFRGSIYHGVSRNKSKWQVSYRPLTCRSWYAAILERSTWAPSTQRKGLPACLTTFPYCSTAQMPSRTSRIPSERF